MLLNKISKTLILIISWSLVGTLCYCSRSKDKPLPGSDFPVPDSSKGKPVGWDFDKQEYRYHQPNPKAKYEISPVNEIKTYKGEEDPYEALYYYLD